MKPQPTPRALHPGAWWLWALGLAVAASRTTSLILLALIVVVAGFVVAERRTSAPWSRSFRSALILGALVIVVRLGFEVVFGIDPGPRTLITLPELPVPTWAAAVTIGGPVTTAGLAVALREGAQIATLIACIGAANSLANPSRLLKVVPGALYEVGLSVVIGLSLIPATVEDVQRLRRARRLRGRPDRGLSGLATIAMSALEGALHRSLQLAASMDDRGYGRSAVVDARTRRTTAALLLGGLMGLLVGLYGLLDAGSPRLLGLPLVVVGCAVAAAGFRLAGRRTIRTRYRPDPWRRPEWITTASGAVPAATLIALGVLTLSGSLIPIIAVLIGLLPAWLTPPQEAPIPTDEPVRAEPRRPLTPSGQAR